jgi:hypothetical protein
VSEVVEIDAFVRLFTAAVARVATRADRRQAVFFGGILDDKLNNYDSQRSSCPTMGAKLLRKFQLLPGA